jgi:lipopolysaccharide export LptBFGC system permease protein LptF
MQHMTMINEYLRKKSLHVFLHIFLSMFLLTIVIEGLSELPRLDMGHYTLAVLSQYVLMLAPRNLYLSFSCITTLSGLLVINQLNNQAELAALYSLGISKKNIVKQLIKPLCLMVLIMTVFAEGCMPYATLYAKKMRTQAISNQPYWLQAQTLWWQENNTLIHATFKRKTNSLSNLQTYELNPQGMVTTLYATHHATFSAPNWVMHHPTKVVFTHNAIHTTHTQDRAIRLNLTPQLFKLTFTDLNQLSLYSLYQRYLSRVTQNNDLTTELIKRLIYPGKNIALLLIAMLIGLLLPTRTQTITTLILSVSMALLCYLSELLPALIYHLTALTLVPCTIITLIIYLICITLLLHHHRIK